MKNVSNKPLIARVQRETYQGMPQRYCLKNGYAVYSFEPLTQEMYNWCFKQTFPRR